MVMRVPIIHEIVKSIRALLPVVNAAQPALPVRSASCIAYVCRISYRQRVWSRL